MSALDFLKDRAAVLALAAACVAGISLMLAALGAGVQAIVVAAAFMAACAFAALAVEYARRCRFCRELDDLAQQGEAAWRLASLLDEPGFLEGRLAYDALVAQGKAASDDVAAHARRAAEYREYVELWVHEVKTPLAAARLISSDLHGEQAERLRGELDRVEDRIDQALYYARAASLEQDFSVRELDLAAVVRQACRKNARTLIDAGTSPDIHIEPGTMVFADAKQLAFILTQVLVNAAKYGASHLAFTAEENGTGPNGRTVLTVADDGCGIPAADVPRVFERGFTGENGRRFGQATGMGLYLCAVMCEKMGLGLAVASEEGTGTRVMVSFPHDRRRLDLSKA